jgi:hypothetical protein
LVVFEIHLHVRCESELTLWTNKSCTPCYWISILKKSLFFVVYLYIISRSHSMTITFTPAIYIWYNTHN